MHDYTKPTRTWGHDYIWRPDPNRQGRTGEATGWGYGINPGDVLVFTGPNGGGSWYRVDAIKYELDPMDQWTARLSYVNRQEALGDLMLRDTIRREDDGMDPEDRASQTPA
jgi:hypothetical protein